MGKTIAGIGKGAILALICMVLLCLVPAGAQKAYATSGTFTKNLNRYGLNVELSWDCVMWYTDQEIEDIQSDPHKITDDFTGKRVVFLATGIGDGTAASPTRSSATTEDYIKQFQELQQYKQFKDINLVVMDMDDTRTTFAERFEPYASDTIKVVSPGDGYITYDSVWYASWADRLYSECDPDYKLVGDGYGYDSYNTAGTFKNQVARPVAFYMDEKGIFRAVTTGSTSVMDSLSRAYGIDVSNLYTTVYLDGSYDTKAAYKVLADNNAKLSAGSKFSWDSDLERIAMTRAAEYAAYPDSDKRPSGNPASSMLTGRLQDTLRTTMTSVSCETPSVDLSDVVGRATSIGAACYVDKDGTYTMVVLAAKPAGGGNGLRAKASKDIGVYTLKKNVSIDLEADLWDDFKKGDTCQMTAKMGDATLKNYQLAWSSSSKGVATVSSEGVVTAVKPGKATISAALSKDTSKKGTYALTVKTIDLSLADTNVSLPKSTYTETGKALTPEPTVTVDGKKLVKGTDYKVSYANNVKPGEATVRVDGIGAYTGAAYAYFDIEEKAAAPTPTPAPAAAKEVRLEGRDAYGTMAAIVKHGFAKSDAVVVATFDGFWDALAASSLAGKVGAPVLLTDPKSLSSACASEIGRLGAKTAYIAGGTAAVSSKVESQLKSRGLEVVRVAGDDAPGTAAEIAEQVGSAASDTCIVATANGYWDALAASPYAYATKSPIYLTGFDGVLASDVVAAIRKGGYRQAVVVGGPAVVSTKTEGTLRSAAGVGSVTRCWGGDAYATAIEFAKWELKHGMGADKMGIATKNGYWDALTGAALCGKNRSVLVLADDGATQAVSQVMKPNKAAIRTYYIFGGKSAVGEKVASACKALWASGTTKLQAASI